MFATELAHSVTCAELDLAIITEPSDNPMLTLVHIASAPLCVAMQADHRAAGKRSVSLEDLKNVGWMLSLGRQIQLSTTAYSTSDES